MRMDCVDRAVSWLFQVVGEFIAKYPGYFIIVPLLVAMCLATGIQRMIYVDDPEYLFSPVNGRSHDERRVVEALFPQNTSYNFDIGRQTKPEKFGRLIVVTKNGKNLLSRKVWDEIIMLDQIIKNMTVLWDDDIWTYEQICARNGRPCYPNEMLDFYPYIDQIENGTFKLEYPLRIDRTRQKVYFTGALMGGIETDSDGFIKSAEAMAMFYYLDTSSRKANLRSQAWEYAFLDLMESLELEHVKLAWFTSRSLAEELEKNTTTVTPFFSITVVIMLAFTVTTCLMADAVRSKPWLGILGCVSAAVSVIAGFGLVIYLGLEFIGINMAAPFLMLGIGMDDTFVLLAAWRRTNPRKSVVDRMGETYREAAVSITITSLTNFISFCIGAITPFPSVKIFCIYTAVAVLFTYIYQITFFGGCMALSGYAERRNLHGLLCFPTMPKSQASGRSWLFKTLCTGGVNPNDPDNPVDNREHAMMTFFRDTWGGILSIFPVKIFVILIFLVYLAIGLWGCTQVKEGLERYKLAMDTSYARDFFNTDDKYFRRYPLRIHVVMNKTMEYWKPDVYDKLEEIVQTFENSSFVQNSELTECWFREYRKQTQDGPFKGYFAQFDLRDPHDYIQGLRFMLRFAPFSTFEKDIKFNENFTSIVASRCIIQATNISDANLEKDMVLDLRRIADSYPDHHITVFHTLFVFFDQFILVRETSIQSIGVAAAVMMVIALIFIPSVSCALWVAFSICSIEIGVIGYMTLWNVNLDSISMINLIMCIGFSVDYSAHISYAYLSSEGLTANDKMKSALHSLGMPIFQGSVSTILGIAILAFAPSYIFLTFFKTVFLVILFGALHGILLLPVLLSLSDSFCKKNKKAIVTHPFFVPPHPSANCKTPPVIITTDNYSSLSVVAKDVKRKLSGELNQEDAWNSGRDMPPNNSSKSLLTNLTNYSTFQERGEQVNPAFLPDEDEEKDVVPGRIAPPYWPAKVQPEERCLHRRHSSNDVKATPLRLSKQYSVPS
ncbi:patched domain-containing protein 3 [Ixodes scapularis]|uniref:patched domain-containing protein 3 n=1 Tax=Ixodes scapularis TaxID=6945 RepID=UPI001A9F8CF9|nr:patched domain-containing protein 3 [Ixodes scapularis]